MPSRDKKNQMQANRDAWPCEVSSNHRKQIHVDAFKPYANKSILPTMKLKNSTKQFATVTMVDKPEANFNNDPGKLGNAEQEGSFTMLELNKENNMWKTNGFNKSTQSAPTSSKQVCARGLESTQQLNIPLMLHITRDQKQL